MTPAAETFQIIRSMFKHAWETRAAQAEEIATKLKAETVRLDRQIEQLLDRVVDAADSSMGSAYERRIAKFGKEKLLASEKLAKKPGPKRTFDEMFELACGFLSSPWNIWRNESMAAKKAVLKLAFAERAAYSRNSGFRTPKTTLLFNMLGDFQGERIMAEKMGFEPTIRF